MFDLTLAHIAVADVQAAERWYTNVFDLPPDTRPMDGLIEWRFGAANGIQVFRDPERAGSTTAVVGVTGLDAVVERLDERGVDHGGIQPGGGGRLVTLTDPDGNRVVFLDPQAAQGRPLDRIVQATLRFERRIAAPAERVWRAYADVGERSQWSVPVGEVVEYDTHDFAQGGFDESRCGPPGDLANNVTTEYLHIDEPTQFVATNTLRREGATVAVDTTRWQLEPDDDTTLLVLTVQVTSLAGPQLLDGFDDGHRRTLDHLEQHLTRNV